MSSELFVNKITGTSGTSGGAPITLSGDTATLGSGVNGHGLITMFDKFYLVNHFNTNNATITPWTRVTSSTHAAYSPLNTGLTQNSGVFSFPENGLYLVQASIQIEQFSGGNDNVATELKVTTNNSNYKVLVRGFDLVTSSVVTSGFQLGPTLINCTDKNNVKFLFASFSLNSGNSIRGTDGDTDDSEDIIYTQFSAMRIGPSQ